MIGLFEGPNIVMTWREEGIKPLFVTEHKASQEDIDNYNLHHPILAHHKTCKCWRCI